jgi:hypothetical protein
MGYRKYQQRHGDLEVLGDKDAADNLLVLLEAGLLHGRRPGLEGFLRELQHYIVTEDIGIEANVICSARVETLCYCPDLEELVSTFQLGSQLSVYGGKGRYINPRIGWYGDVSRNLNSTFINFLCFLIATCYNSRIGCTAPKQKESTNNLRKS